VSRASPSTERQSARQRRIEEQRRKIESARRQQRRKRFMVGGIAVAIAALLIVAVLVFFPRPVSGQMHQVPAEQGSHVSTPEELVYQTRPPSSGPHFGQVPSQSDYRVYDQPVSPGLWVHMLEHGSIVILYRPDLCDQTCRAQLGDVYDSAPASTVFRIRKLAVIPWTDMDHAIAVVAWGYIDEMDQVDKDRILADYRSRLDKGPEIAM
jgi:hypothetical protein